MSSADRTERVTWMAGDPMLDMTLSALSPFYVPPSALARMTIDDLRRLAPDGASVDLLPYTTQNLVVRIQHPAYSRDMVLEIVGANDETGAPAHVKFHSMGARQTASHGAGFGSLSYLRTIELLRQQGVEHFHLLAQGGLDSDDTPATGNQVWPLLGADGAIPESLYLRMQEPRHEEVVRRISTVPYLHATVADIVFNDDGSLNEAGIRFLRAGDESLLLGYDFSDAKTLARWERTLDAMGLSSLLSSSSSTERALLDRWADDAVAGLETLDQTREAYLRELTAYYRSGLSASFANRRAFEDDLLADSTVDRTVSFVEVPGTLKAVNDSVGHVAADELLQTLMALAADIGSQPEFKDVARYHLGAARFAFEGPPEATEQFTAALTDRIGQLRFGYVADGVHYEQTGLPLVHAQFSANGASSRRALLFAGMDELERATEPLKNTVLPQERGAPLLTLQRSDAQGEAPRAWLNEAVDDADASTVVDGTVPTRRATERLADPLRAVLRDRAQAVNDVEEGKRTIAQTVKAGFSTDPTFGSRLGNQLAFDRAEQERVRDGQPTWHGFVDVGAVGVTNTQISRFAGDTVLEAVHATAAESAAAFNEALGLEGSRRIEVFAVGGDELRFMAADRTQAEQFGQWLVEDMGETTIEGETAEFGLPLQHVHLSQVPLYAGTGATMAQAEEKSNARKAGDPQRVPGRLPPNYVQSEAER
jgi:hypothetical protein